MLYKNDSIDALYACERERTGNYGDDEFKTNPFDKTITAPTPQWECLPKGFDVSLKLI